MSTLTNHGGNARTQTDALSGRWAAAESGNHDDQLAYIRAVMSAPQTNAQEHYAKAARLLNDLLAAAPDAELMVLTGWMLARGNGYAANPQRAREMMVAAAAAGSADAHFELSIYLTTGFGGEVQPQAAMEHLRQAAKLGQPRAMANLAASYASGTGVDRNPAKARTWYERAADAGNARAALALARMYREGIGGAADSGAEQRMRARARELSDPQRSV